MSGNGVDTTTPQSLSPRAAIGMGMLFLAFGVFPILVAAGLIPRHEADAPP